jgi:acetate kinase
VDVILVVNFGGSSLKYRAYSIPDLSVVNRGHIERLGTDGAMMKVWDSGSSRATEKKVSARNPSEALELLFSELNIKGKADGTGYTIRAVAHKLAHGGPRYLAPAVIDEGVIAALEKFASVVPLHNGLSLTAIRAVREVLGDVVQVGVFETGFHTSLPAWATTYGLPYELCEEYGLRKYGFHGASHRYVSEQVPRIAGLPADNIRLVSCHLGSGTSVAAIRNGVSVEVSSGFTPQSGTMMSSRPGDYDGEVLLYLLIEGIKTVPEIRTMLIEESGLKGISGVSEDLRDVMAAVRGGNDRATLAVDTFCYRVRQHIGMCVTALGGVDAIAFTGGIGERNAEIRQRVCAGLEFLGVSISDALNLHPDPPALVNGADSRVKVVVLETDEEYIVAKQAMDTIQHR